MHAGGGKQTICWHCLKPLPRCSICLMHMGSEIGGCDDVTDEVEVGDPAINGHHRKRSEVVKLPLLTRNSVVGGRSLMKTSVSSMAGIPGVKMTRIDVTK